MDMQNKTRRDIVFRIGTNLTTSADAPALDCAYKLQEYAGIPRRKRSVGKGPWPGRRQIWRSRAADGQLTGDLVALGNECHDGEPLLCPVMRQGKRVGQATLLSEACEHARDELAHLPTPLRRLESFAYPVTISAKLRGSAAALDYQNGADAALP